MWKKSMSPTEKTIYERLGNILTFWYPSTPKTYGITFLREFLESHDAWGRFIKNFHSVAKAKDFEKHFQYILNTKDYRKVIEWAFIWSKTDEGVMYWYQLQLQFNYFLDQKEQEGINLATLAISSKEKTKQQIIMDPIYAWLSGATSCMQHTVTRPTQKKKLGFKVPISATTIFGTSL